MSQNQRILNPALGLPLNIILKGTGMRNRVFNGENFQRVPIEDYQHQGVAPSSVRPGQQAYGNLVVNTANAANNDTLTFTFPDASTRVYTFKSSSPSGANQVLIGASPGATAANLAAAITADTGGGGVAGKLVVQSVSGAQVNLQIGSTYVGTAGNTTVMSTSDASAFTFTQFTYGQNAWQDYVDVYAGTNGANEVWKFVPSGVPASGSFAIQFFGNPDIVTGPIPYNATAAQIQAAILQVFNPYNNEPMSTVVTGALSDTSNGFTVTAVAPGAAGLNIPMAIVSNTLETSAPAAITFTPTEVTPGAEPSSESGPDLDLSGVYQLYCLPQSPTTPYTWEDAATNTLARLVPVETVRNANT